MGSDAFSFRDATQTLARLLIAEWLTLIITYTTLIIQALKAWNTSSALLTVKKQILHQAIYKLIQLNLMYMLKAACNFKLHWNNLI
ncbi:hypothetical protein BV378_35150 [Nostoc sp. RF31YmG]|nr:hypothetical protein BV378_35150 [Nostoc sp. RF31YmG]